MSSSTLVPEIWIFNGLYESSHEALATKVWLQCKRQHAVNIIEAGN